MIPNVALPIQNKGMWITIIILALLLIFAYIAYRNEKRENENLKLIIQSK